MNSFRLYRKFSGKLVVCALLSNSLFSNAQDKADTIANELISKQVQSADSVKVEEALKQQRELYGDGLRMSAEKSYKEGNYGQAIEGYLQAIDKYKRVSRSEPRVIAKLKNSQAMLATVYTKYAEVLIKKAEAEESINLFEKADALFLKVLEVNPERDGEMAKKRAMLAERRESVKRAQAVDAKGLRRASKLREEEKQWRIEQSQILLANRRYMDAKAILEEVLILDPFDSKAAALVLRINKKLFLSGRARRAATVQERIDEVEWKWSLPLSSDFLTGSDDIVKEGRIPISGEVAAVHEKLKIVIPRFSHYATIEKVIDALKVASIEQDPDKKGLTIIYRPKEKVYESSGVDQPTPEKTLFEDVDPFAEENTLGDGEKTEEAGGALAERTYQFDFENMPIGEIIRYICISSNLKYKIDSYAVIIADQSVKVDEMVTRFYPVNSSVFSELGENAPVGEEGGLDIGDLDGGEGGEGDIRKYFDALGITFHAGAQVIYLPGVSRLVMTNTVTEQRRVSEILNQLHVDAAQVIVESKFVEINQRNLDEFGFQWSLQTSAAHDRHLNFIPNLEQSEIAAVEGVNNTLQDLLINATGAPGQDGIPDIGADGQPVPGDGDFIDLAGNPSLRLQPEDDIAETLAESLFPGAGNIGNNGSSGIPVVGGLGSASSGGLSSGIRDVSSLLGQQQRGQLSFTSTFGNNQFNTVIRALSQHSNNDILSAPKVITQNGNTAIIRIVEERFFPESWEPPAISVTGEGVGTQLSIKASSPNYGDPVDIGVVLEVTPQVDPDGVSIEVELRPQVRQLVGFDTSFNSDIYVANFANPAAVSRYDVPIITARAIDTRVKIWDGETIVLGGLIQETVTTVNDRVPILADIPLIGWLFENKGENRQKQNLLIFVSARLVNNAGLPIRESNIRGLPDFKRL